MYHEIISAEEIEVLKAAAFPGKITVITKKGRSLTCAIKHLKEQRFIGFDTETRPTFQPNMPRSGTALLQLSSENNAYLFRLQTLGLPQELAEILADPYITKVGAAVHDDIRGLQRYFPFEPKRFVDLQQIAEGYGIREKSVRKMAAIILGMRVSKSQQLSNWEAEELNSSQQLYAATDAWVCVKMYKALLGSPRVELKHDDL